ncbi:helix-turn-helix domain-containing protein [Modestobacter sp. I12A-02628]|uniref:Glycerol operon regulatory protein n=1 Tax=Goekera deserti TaxID=2497753 RepID=A0A7K3WG05_9ACTN|nr:IclR family transcriptional regulator [Goekera deserti]MPR00399.1 helix-turn-helix domain-containing protein [Goekera deserti]NDI50397.1 helix-turn-helix domain-containing protein [Goekera deserti]NEL55337.1 IclR family transcriptional regulator [Goekera deserti]
MPGTVQSIERAAAILQVVAGSGGTLGVTEIAGAVGLAKTTTHSLLRTLLAVGFVDQDRSTGRYSLGAGLLRLGAGHLDVNELRARASNWADALASRSGQAVRLATLAGDHVDVVHHVFRPDDSVQVLDVGTRLPAATTALGKVLLASAAGRHGGGTGVGDVAVDRVELAEVRARGWATGRVGPDLGVSGLAAPVRGSTGLVVAALGISGPTSVVLDGRGAPRPALLTMVLDAAQAVSRELGHSG